MRDLTRHPVTKREMLVALEWALTQARAPDPVQGPMIGDIKPAALQAVIQLVQAIPDSEPARPTPQEYLLRLQNANPDLEAEALLRAIMTPDHSV